MSIYKDIKNYKEQLIRKAKRIGIWENFGQTEVEILRQNYSIHKFTNDEVWKTIKIFDNWCMNFDTIEMRN